MKKLLCFAAASLIIGQASAITVDHELYSIRVIGLDDHFYESNSSSNPIVGIFNTELLFKLPSAAWFDQIDIQITSKRQEELLSHQVMFAGWAKGAEHGGFAFSYSNISFDAIREGALTHKSDIGVR